MQKSVDAPLYYVMSHAISYCLIQLANVPCNYLVPNSGIYYPHASILGSEQWQVYSRSKLNTKQEDMSLEGHDIPVAHDQRESHVQLEYQINGGGVGAGNNWKGWKMSYKLIVEGLEQMGWWEI